MLIMVNVDDVSGEAVPHVIEGLIARGACNVHVVQSLTKKGRMEYLFFIDAPEEHVERLGGFMACEMGTIGLRILENKHIKFEYRMQRVRLQHSGGAGIDVRVKEIMGEAGRVLSLKAEHEDLRAAHELLKPLAEHISLPGLKRLAEQSAQGRQECAYGEITARYQGQSGVA
jgi:hypothetical protein